MSGEELRDLVELDPAKFDGREHAALCWVRAILTDRDGAPADVRKRFEEAFDEREREHVIATMKSMYFFNLTGNTLDGWMRRLLSRDDEQTTECAVHVE